MCCSPGRARDSFSALNATLDSVAHRFLTLGPQRRRGKQRRPRRRGPRERRRRPSRASRVPAAARISRRRSSRAPPSALAHAAGTARWLVKLPLAVRALDVLHYGRRLPSLRGLRHSQTPPALPGPFLDAKAARASLPGEGPGPKARVLFLAQGSRTYPISPSGELAPGTPPALPDISRRVHLPQTSGS